MYRDVTRATWAYSIVPLAAALLAGGMYSCGQLTNNGTSNPMANGNSNGTNPPAGDGRVAMKGTICYRATMAIPEDERETAMQNRATIEALGAALTDDGSSVSFDSNTAGWQVVLGDESVTADAENNFTITVVEGGETNGTIFDHTGEKPWGFFTVDDLAAEDETPTPIEVAFEIRGGCCMDGPDDPCCAVADTAAAAKIMPERHAGTTPPKTIRKIAGQSLSYPSGAETTCLDYDGPIFPGDNSSEGTALNYLGSTCYDNVANGCCANENGTIAFLVLDLDDFERYYGTFENCANNHKGRFCQEIEKGNVGWIPSGEIPVKLGETVSSALHNNGCFGVTRLAASLTNLDGELTSDHDDGLFVTHFDTGGPAGVYGGFIYHADRTIEFTAPKCVQSTSNMRDTYTAVVDGNAASITFQLVTENLWKFRDGIDIFSADRAAEDGFRIAETEEPSEANDFKGCDDFHLHGAHPCTGAADPDEKGCGHGKIVPAG